MLPKNAELPLGDYVATFEKEEIIRQEAEEAVAHCAKEGRDDETVFANIHRGIVLQYAFAAYLISIGYSVLVARDEDKHYDLIVGGLKIDVKGRWSGKYFQQTKWESWAVPFRGNDVLYVCIDVMPDGRYIYRGCCWSTNLTASSRGQPFVTQYSEVL